MRREARRPKQHQYLKGLYLDPVKDITILKASYFNSSANQKASVFISSKKEKGLLHSKHNGMSHDIALFKSMVRLLPVGYLIPVEGNLWKVD